MRATSPRGRRKSWSESQRGKITGASPRNYSSPEKQCDGIFEALMQSSASTTVHSPPDSGLERISGAAALNPFTPRLFQVSIFLKLMLITRLVLDRRG